MILVSILTVVTSFFLFYSFLYAFDRQKEPSDKALLLVLASVAFLVNFLTLVCAFSPTKVIKDYQDGKYTEYTTIKVNSNEYPSHVTKRRYRKTE